jgi:3-hydroxyisobutyrate dehydrogenase-like beta-hydroxyacid dehydrogenase
MNSTLDRIGIIGTGNMGAPMALHLLDIGARVTVYDRSAQATAALAERGAAVVSTPRELADQVDVILASMPSYEASVEVALGAQGIVHGREAKVYIETSTLGSAAMRAIASELAARDIGFLDAPVSGGPPGARAGTLSVLVSGAKNVFERSRPVLESIASNVFYLGERPGTSQIVKLINNHVSAAGRLAVLEGLAMGVKAGIDPKTLNDVLNASSGRNYTTTDKVPAAILTGTYKFNGPLTIGLKDQALLLEEARRLGARMWIAPRVLETYEEAAAAGYRDQDGMRLFLYMQEQSAVHDGADSSDTDKS